MKKNSRHILILGCGQNKSTGTVCVDNNPEVKPDVIHDLNKFPYPFKTGQFDKIIAHNIIEHLDHVIRVMEEIHRIAKPNATLEIVTGHFSGVDSFTDPTHKHFFTSRSFDYFIPGCDLYKYRYSKARYSRQRVLLGPENHSNKLIRFVLKLINQHIAFYESRLAFIFPVGVIYYKLKVIK